MTLTYTCELTSRLPRHLRGTLPPEEEQAFVEHLDGCEVCQQCLERLAVGAHAHLLATARDLDEEPVTAHFDLSRLVARLGQQSMVDTLPLEPVAQADAAALDFLDPPREASHLGRLGDYEVTELIARGGMGIVLKAIDEKLGRTVCLKVLAPHIAANPTSRQRFLREARAAAAVHSPHVVPIHAVDEAAGLPYLVFEYVAGQSLQQCVAEHGPLPIEDAIRIGRDVATGLAAVHDLGLVHRDVKPGNILIDDATGAARLTDFGLARAVDDTSITRDGIVGGTPEYMSPEQARGRAVDHRSDLFSLGSVLYLMITGRLAFEADGSLATLKLVCDEAPPPIPPLRNSALPGLVELVSRLHAKRPADRPQSAVEVIQALSPNSGDHWRLSALLGDQPRSDRSHDAKSAAAWLRPVLYYPAAAGILALTLLVGLTGLWQVIVRIQGPDGKTTVIHPPDGATVQLEQNGRQVASVKNASTDKESRPLDGHRGDVWSVAFAGERLGLSAGGDNWVRVWDLESGKEVQRFDGHMSFVYSLAVSPDGRRALSGSGPPLGATQESVNWSVCLWDIESGKELHRLEGHSAGATSVAFSKDGQQALLGFYDGDVRLLDVDKWSEISRFKAPRGLWSVCISPDGSRALTAGGDNNESMIRLWSLPDGKEIRRYTGHKWGTWHAVFLPDGRSFLSGGQDETIRHWETDTGTQLAMLRHQGQVTRIALTADGRFALAGAWVSAGKHSLRLFQIDQAKEIRAFQGNSTPLNAVALSPSGRLGLVGGNDGSVGVWKMPDVIAAAPK